MRSVKLLLRIILIKHDYYLRNSKQGTGNVSPQTSINSSGKGSATQESKGTNTKDTNSNESKEKEKVQVRYPATH